MSNIDFSHLSALFVEPLHFFAVLPEAWLLLAVNAYVGALAVLFACLPLTDVFASIGPAERAVTFALVIHEGTLVLLLVLPNQGAFSMHFVVAPLALILFAIGPRVFACAADLVLSELSFVITAVSEGKLAPSFLLSVNVLSFILCTIWPRLHSVAMLLVIDPVAIVVGSVSVRVGAFSVGFVINPLAFVDIAISMNKLASAIGFVLAPKSIVLGAIWPLLRTLAISDVVEPLAFIDRSVLESNSSSVNTTVLIRLLMVHTEILVGINTVVLIVHASVEAIVLHLGVLVHELVLMHVAASHHGRTIVFIDVLFEGSGIALDLGCLDFFGVVSAVAAVVGTTSHFLWQIYK